MSDAPRPHRDPTHHPRTAGPATAGPAAAAARRARTGPTRRAALAALAALAAGTAAACAQDPSTAPSAAPSTPVPDPTTPAAGAPTATATPTPTPTPVVPVVPAVVPYALLAGEVEPACKQAALDVAAAAWTVDAADADPAASLATRLAAVGQPPGPALVLRDLVPAGASAAVEVRYPQYGGLSTPRTSASVMLVADLLVAPPGQLALPGAPPPEPERRSTTVDVRLRGEGGRWTVTEVLVPTLPAPVAEGELTEAARRLAAEERVVLPGAARADLLSGGVHDAVLTALLELAQTWRLDVQVLTSGHPVNVFATDRVSNHTRGRAVDLWALDGIPVVDQERCPWREVMEAATALGASEVGGPQSLGRRGHFTDQVHQDHLHLGFGRA